MPVPLTMGSPPRDSRSVNGVAMPSGQSAFARTPWISLTGVRVPMTTRHVHTEEIHRQRQATVNCFLKRALRVAAPWESFYTWLLWSAGQTQTQEAVPAPQWNVTAHISAGLREKRVRLLGWSLCKTKVSQDSGPTRPARFRHEPAHESIFQSRSDFSRSGVGPRVCISN